MIKPHEHPVVQLLDALDDSFSTDTTSDDIRDLVAVLNRALLPVVVLTGKIGRRLEVLAEQNGDVSAHAAAEVRSAAGDLNDAVTRFEQATGMV